MCSFSQKMWILFALNFLYLQKIWFLQINLWYLYLVSSVCVITWNTLNSFIFGLAVVWWQSILRKYLADKRFLSKVYLFLTNLPWPHHSPRRETLPRNFKVICWRPLISSIISDRHMNYSGRVYLLYMILPHSQRYWNVTKKIEKTEKDFYIKKISYIYIPNV